MCGFDTKLVFPEISINVRHQVIDSVETDPLRAVQVKMPNRISTWLSQLAEVGS